MAATEINQNFQGVSLTCAGSELQMQLVAHFIEESIVGLQLMSRYQLQLGFN